MTAFWGLVMAAAITSAPGMHVFFVRQRWGVQRPTLEGVKSSGGTTPMRTRREMMRQAGTAAVLATTSPWWLVRRAHAARQAKLVVWVSTALAPQVDKIMQEQCYAYAKQAGI